MSYSQKTNRITNLTSFRKHISSIKTNEAKNEETVPTQTTSMRTQESA